MPERFDILFEGLEEEKALKLLKVNPEELKNPVEKYTAATKLAACTSDRSLEVLIEATDLNSDNLFNRITRRKVLEALGRRRDARALPCLFKALNFDDETSVINAVNSIAQIGETLTTSQSALLSKALNGSDNQKRAVIQTHTKLAIVQGENEISILETYVNPLVAGAARTYAAKVHGHIERLTPIIKQLTDAVSGRRRAAVIDLGDAGDINVLPQLIRSPVSMPLRAKSAFQHVDPNKTGKVPENYRNLISQLLRDDPSSLSLLEEWICGADQTEIEKNLQHRDEGKQYGGALTLMRMPKQQQIESIDQIYVRYWSDYGTNYLLTAVIGVNRIQERQELVRTSLAETLPQYAKSRVAAAWVCLSLGLLDQTNASG